MTEERKITMANGSTITFGPASGEVLRSFTEMPPEAKAAHKKGEGMTVADLINQLVDYPSDLQVWLPHPDGGRSEPCMGAYVSSHPVEDHGEVLYLLLESEMQPSDFEP